MGLVDGVGRGRTAPIPPSSRQTSLEEEERELREPLAKPDLTKDVRVINDLLDDLSRLDSHDKLSLRGLNNNDTARPGLIKQTSLISTGSSRGSAHDSLILDNQGNEKVLGIGTDIP